MRVLVTGGAGYIGSNAVKYFLNIGWEVVAMVHKATTSLPVKTITADLNDLDSLDRVFDGEQYDYVVHIAARASDVGADRLFRTANFEAVKRLATSAVANGVKRFLYLSTADVYGLHDFHGETEAELLFDYKVTNPYPKYKILAEEWLQANIPQEKFACIRPCVVWGNGDTTITPRAIAFLKSSPFVLHFGPWRGENRWPLAHVENVCRAIHAALIVSGAGGKGITVLDSKVTTMSQYYRELATEYLPNKRIRELCLPTFLIYPVAWLSTKLSVNRPLWDPTLYALDTITHNLDFSNQLMLEILSQANLKEFTS